MSTRPAGRDDEEPPADSVPGAAPPAHAEGHEPGGQQAGSSGGQQAGSSGGRGERRRRRLGISALSDERSLSRGIDYGSMYSYRYANNMGIQAGTDLENQLWVFKF